jgi:hypothetical protein
MQTTHNTFRAWGNAIGLSLLLATGTAALMGLLSGPAPGGNRPLDLGAAHRTAAQPPGSDTLLYERVARSNGSYQWVLTAESGAALRTPVAAGLQNVSYTLLARPAGLKKVVKNCNTYSAASRAMTYDAYDIACNTLG